MTRQEISDRIEYPGWLMRESWLQMFSDLPETTAGQLIKSVAAGVEGVVYETDDPVVRALSVMMVTELMQNRDRYMETVIRNRKAAEARKAAKKESKEVAAPAAQEDVTEPTPDPDEDDDGLPFG